MHGQSHSDGEGVADGYRFHAYRGAAGNPNGGARVRPERSRPGGTEDRRGARSVTGFQLAKPAYAEACKRGIAFSMLPKEYGGGGLSNVDFVIAAEEIQAVDPGFGTAVLVNGLGLMPVWYYGTEEQKERFIGARDRRHAAASSSSATRPASRPGSPGGTANFDAPAVDGAGMGVTAALDGDEYVINGRKYWPCNVGGWDNQGANLNLVVVRTDASHGGPSGLSAIIVERGTPGITYNSISTSAQRTAPNCEIIFDNARVPASNMIEGAKGNGDLLINRNFAWSGPVAGIGAVAVARAAYEDALRVGEDLHGGRPQADHSLPVPRLRARRRCREDRGGALLLLEERALPRPARLPRRDARRDVQDPLHRDAIRLRLQVHAGRRGELRRQEVQVRPLPAGGRAFCRSTTPATSGCSAAACMASWPIRRSIRARSWTTRRSSSPRRWRGSEPSQARPVKGDPETGGPASGRSAGDDLGGPVERVLHLTAPALSGRPVAAASGQADARR